MSPLEQAVLSRKLAHLQELLELLKPEASTPLATFLQDRRQQLLVERLLHLSIEAASDLLAHLLVQSNGVRPQTYADTFVLAGEHQWISGDLALRLIPAAGLRNRLVHDYEAIDPIRVHGSMAAALQDLEALIRELTSRMAM